MIIEDLSLSISQQTKNTHTRNKGKCWIVLNLLLQPVTGASTHTRATHAARARAHTHTLRRQMSLKPQLSALIRRVETLNKPLATADTSSRMNKLSRSRFYSHKNSEKKNSDSDLQRQFAHVFPAVGGRHIHGSPIIRQVQWTQAVLLRSECWSLL